jgi:tetratricopeptide (TPR) repeat protein
LAQDKKLSKKESKKVLDEVIDPKASLKQNAENACKCIDSIQINNKGTKQIHAEVGQCIDKEVMGYQATKKILEALKDVNSKSHTIEIASDSTSPEYKKYYFEIERELRDQCEAMNSIVALNNEASENSISVSTLAQQFYEEGNEEYAKENYFNAVSKYKRALAIDSMFAFCWDNLGLTYRKMEKYDEAIAAYRRSLQVDPNGKTPLQNIPVAYEYQHKYPEAIQSYRDYIAKQAKDPEGFYGLGRVLVMQDELEDGLDNLCKAYNLYISLNSPYRTDAEQVISLVYSKMKKANKVKEFKEILEKNDIKMEMGK